MDPKTLPQAIRTDDPTTPPDVTNFAQPLIATLQGALWSAAVDPVTGEPVATVQLPQNIPIDTRAMVIAAAVYGTSPTTDEQRACNGLSVSGFADDDPFDSFRGIATVSHSLYADTSDGVFSQALAADLLTDGQDFDFSNPRAGVGIVQAFGGGLTGVGNATYDRLRVASATVIGAATSKGAQLAAAPGEWPLTSAPAANTQATATRAAGGAGVRHVLRSINASITATAAITAPLTVVVRDGASGVGAIIWQERLTALAGTQDRVTLSGLNLVGSANTAMTVEFTAAPGATNFETLAATGFDAVA